MPRGSVLLQQNFTQFACCSSFQLFLVHFLLIQRDSWFLTVAHCGSLWLISAHYDQSWLIVAHFGQYQLIMSCWDLSWLMDVHYGLLCLIMSYCASLQLIACFSISQKVQHRRYFKICINVNDLALAVICMSVCYNTDNIFKDFFKGF